MSLISHHFPYCTTYHTVILAHVTLVSSKPNINFYEYHIAGFIGEGKSALTDEEITVLVSCADKDGNGTTLSKIINLLYAIQVL